MARSVSCASLYAVVTHNVLTINTECLAKPNESASLITTRQALGKLDSNLGYNTWKQVCTYSAGFIN